MWLRLAVLLALLGLVVGESKGFLKKEVMKKRSDFVMKGIPEPDTQHEVIFAVKQLNLDKLEGEVLERATPGSPNYLKWMTFQEVGDLITNHDGAQATIDWLVSHDIKYTWMSKRKEYIKATAPVHIWETLFDTKFYSWADENPNSGGNGLIIRANHHSLPENIADHIDGVFSTVQAPPVIPKRFHRPAGEPFRKDIRPNLRRVQEALNRAEEKAEGNLVTTVTYLSQFYNITSNTGHPFVGQSVFETDGEYFSQADLAEFQSYYGLPPQTALDIGEHETSSCNSVKDCSGGNLELQYIMGIAQNTASTYWYIDDQGDPFTAWITAIADEQNPPRSNSLSWSTIEQGVSTSVLNSFKSEAMKLAALGVTVTVATGDYGVSNFMCACSANSGSSESSWTGANSWEGEGYFPSFPASCPYVTAIGATMGANGYPPAVGSTELTCQSQLGGVITSAGGFSTYYATPSWQASATSTYLGQFDAANAPAPGYNSYGRGIPDLSLVGVYYQAVVGGNFMSFFGTSASTPVAAAMVTLINSARAVKGLGSIGFINPTIYANAAKFKDIDSGKNSCCAGHDASSVTCCDSGFDATSGWDPLTGLGSVSYTNFASMFGV